MLSKKISQLLSKKRVFLDYASTTPVDTRVLKAMWPFESFHFANPSAIYKEGVLTRTAIENARKDVARVLEVKPDTILFTGGGTEANNIAILGVIDAAKRTSTARPHIVTTTIEHASVLEVCRALEIEGVDVTYVKPGEDGVVRSEVIRDALRPETVLVSVMYVNNEIGTIAPLRAISQVIQEYRKKVPTCSAVFHTDACQAVNHLSVQVESLGVDMMTLDASKFYGPKGTGILFVKRTVALHPVVLGGGQERGIRSGTENVSGIVGCARALVLASEMRVKESTRLKSLQSFFIDEILTLFPGVILNGSLEKRIPNNVNVCFSGIDSEFAVISLDAAGVAVSAASACNNLHTDAHSYVIRSIARDPDCANSSLRFTFGRETAKRDLVHALAVLKKVIPKLQE